MLERTALSLLCSTDSQRSRCVEVDALNIQELIVIMLICLVIDYAEEIMKILYYVAFWIIVGFFYLLGSIFVGIFWIVDKLLGFIHGE